MTTAGECVVYACCLPDGHSGLHVDKGGNMWANTRSFGGSLMPIPGMDETAEHRVTSPTGGQKGTKRAQLGGLDPRALLLLAEVAGMGAGKYDRYNMMKGYDWSLSFDALQRHLLAFWSGEDNDPESGLPHVAHAMWHCGTLLSFMLDHPDYDDRPPCGQNSA